MGSPANGDKKNIVKLAYLYFQEGRWDSAIEEYKKLLELDPGDINTHNMLGDVYVKKNAPAQAYEEYTKVLEDLLNRDQVDKAALLNKKIARLDRSQLPPEAQQKQNLIQLHLKADTAIEENRIEEAIEAFVEILKLDPEELMVAAKLAELEEKIGQIPEAVEQYTRIGESFLKNHLFKKAQEMFKKVAAIDPQNVPARLNLAQIYIKQGSESDAKKEYLNVAEQALAKDDLDSAFEYAGKAVELKSIEAHYIVGIVLFKRQKWDQAKVEFDNLLRFKVNHVGALVYLGRVYAAMEQLEKAAETFQKALKLDKDNMAALEAWAEYCVKRKNKTEAVQTLNTLIDKAIAGNIYGRGITWARILVSVDEGSASSQLKLAQVIEKSGDLNGAADAYYDLALLQGRQNKREESLLYARKALELNPTHSKALSLAPEAVPSSDSSEGPASVASAPDEAAESKVHLSEQSKAPEVGVSPQEAFKAQADVAEQYVKQGLLDEAIEIYQQLLEVDPENSEVKKKLNAVYAAYAKTGTDLTSVFAADKAPEEPKKTNSDAAKKDLKELEMRARQEAEKKANEEIKRLAAEREKNAKASVVPHKTEKVPMTGGLDEMVAVAEADLLRNQGRNEEAAGKYRLFLASHPGHEDVLKKLSAVEEILKSKTASGPGSKTPPVLKVVESPVNSAVPPLVPDGEKDANIKKKSNKIGYV